MNYATIKNNDIANGLGVRVSLFVSGCTHNCPGCFNQEAQDFNYGEHFSQDIADDILDKLKAPHIAGLTLLGGEPMEPSNQTALLPFIKQYKRLYPHKDLWIYTGYTWEELTNKTSKCHTDATNELLSLTDILVDGEFMLDKHNLLVKHRGSSNQRIIDVQATLTNNIITERNDLYV